MNKLDAQRQKEIQQAEELLFAGPQALGFAKGLFQGHFVADWVMPYPRIPAAQQPELDETLTELRQFLDEHLDPAEIDRKADIPRSVIDGLGRIGVLGMTAPKEYGGRGFSQMANCKILEEIGRRCASTSVFVNAHHSIGIRALLLFGTHEQQERWLPQLSTGEKLGPYGKGLKVALTVLDFGRTTFGACCTGAAKTCLRLAIEHANTRKQFNKTLGNFHLVQKKIARIAADAYAMDAMTTITAALIDRGLEDYMLETAMLKVFTTERLWECINDVFQIYGGSAYFVDRPLERMMRDARINQIGEGANEVLTSFIALVGMRGPGMEFKEIYDTMMKPTRERGFAKAWIAGKHRLGATVRVPEIPVRSPELRWFANQLGRLIRRFNVAVNRALITYREPILDMQLLQERIANAAMDLLASACVLSRQDSEIQFAQRNGSSSTPNQFAADLFLRQSFRRIRHFLAGLTDNDDKSVLATANSLLGKPATNSERIRE